MIKSTRQIMEDMVINEDKYLKQEEIDRLYEELNLYHKKGDSIMTGKILDILHTIYDNNLRENAIKSGLKDPDTFKNLSLYEILDLVHKLRDEK